MTWIKICGMTNLEDARVAAEAGADAVGFVFAKSARQIAPADAAGIAAQLPSEVQKVGVFVNELPSRVREIVSAVGLTAVQLHGNESVEYASVLFGPDEDYKVFRALSVKTLFSVTSGASALRGEKAREIFDAVLVDSGSSTQQGGTGLTFDWMRAQPFINGLKKSYKVIVAGGLTPENVAEAVKLFQPWGVDVASGVEAAPGRKDHEKTRQFIRAVRQAGKKTLLKS